MRRHRSIAARTWTAILLAVLVAPFAGAQNDDPLGDNKLGTLRVTSFDARTVFSVGDVDSVDLRTGNLTFGVPIGGPQKVRGALSYELKAVFNSSLWSRRNMGLYPDEPPPTPSRPLAAEYPDAAFNLGWGWAFHLGRLIEPRFFDGGPPSCDQTDPFLFEKWVDPSPRYVYIDANGTRHEFWRELHGDVNRNDPAHEDATYLYARDGSFLRIRKVADNKRWVDAPNGVKSLFIRFSSPHKTMPDRWRLWRIVDPYGNKLQIRYLNQVTIDGQTFQGGWRIFDQEDGGNPWRETLVGFVDWPGRTAEQPMVAKKVRLPGFGGGERIYELSYTLDHMVDRPPVSSWHGVLAVNCQIDVRASRPRLDWIEQPDGKRFTFDYDTTLTDDVQLESALLPTGGTISYEYNQMWDSPPDCRGGPINAGTHAAVSERTVTDAAGTLARKRFLRQIQRTPDTPAGICQVHEPNNFSQVRPWSEQVVAIWTDHQNFNNQSDLSSVAVHYFNIYPFSDKCAVGMPGCDGKGRLESGRTHAERNMMISRTPSAINPLPGDPNLHLSTELYSCPWDIASGPAVGFDMLFGADQAGDRVEDLNLDASCEKREEAYAQYEVALAGQCKPYSGECLRDSRLKRRRTIYPTDGDRFVQLDNADFDGLGHYRSTVSRSNFASGGNGSIVQNKFQNYNDGVGTLELNPDHSIKQNITVPTTWLLETYRELWTEEDGVYAGGEACFHASQGHKTFDRTWVTTQINPGNLPANRGSQDLVVKHAVNGQGELDLQRFFGADTYPGTMPMDNGWCNNGSAWGAAQQDYLMDYTHAFGFLKEKRVLGATVYEVRRDVDIGTGWTESETLDSGEVLSYLYDPMGRTEWITSDQALSASRRFQYQHVGGRWQLTENVYTRGTLPGGTPPAPIRTYTAKYDGLGRLREEILPKYDSTTVSRTVSYHPGGEVFKVSALDNANRKTTFEVDIRGRVEKQTNPDNSKLNNIYAGVRKTRARTCIRTTTDNPGASGICPAHLERAETTTIRDFRGRTTSVKRPVDEDTGKYITTTFFYDPQGNRTRATRSNPEPGGTVTQARNWFYDGRSFMTRENLPERSLSDFEDFNTRGQPRKRTEAGRVTRPAYDSLGRMTEIRVDNRLVKSFAYGAAGGANGQLTMAVRNNYRGAATSGVGASGNWRASSTFFYDAAGRRTDRTTGVQWIPDVGNPSGLTNFVQGWGYDLDGLSNVTTITYPDSVGQSQPSPSRDVTQQYSKGFYLTRVDSESLGTTLRYHASGLVYEIQHHGSAGGTDRFNVAQGMPRISAVDLARGTTSRLNLGALTYDYAGNLYAMGGDSFRYDEKDRLVTATVQGNAYNYQYDNFDNHRLGTGTIDPTSNHLIGDTTYDAFGNWTSGAGGAVTAVYDELDKMAAFNPPSGSQLAVYDHDDLRVMHLDSTLPGTELIWTLRDGPRVVREFAGISPSIQLRREYLYAGARRISSKEWPSGVTRQYHEDQIGSARLITSPQVATKQAHYQPFGLKITAGGSGERTVGFSGHEDDGDTTYMRARTYFPLSARFLQVDPVRSMGAWSLYAYAENNPVRLVDPTGLEPNDKDAVLAVGGMKLAVEGREHLFSRLPGASSDAAAKALGQAARVTAGGLGGVLAAGQLAQGDVKGGATSAALSFLTFMGSGAALPLTIVKVADTGVQAATGENSTLGFLVGGPMRLAENQVRRATNETNPDREAMKSTLQSRLGKNQLKLNKLNRRLSGYNRHNFDDPKEFDKLEQARNDLADEQARIREKLAALEEDLFLPPE